MYTRTAQFNEACYDLSTFQRLSESAYWGEDMNCKIIYGEDVPMEIKKLYKLQLIDTCGYIFHTYVWDGVPGGKPSVRLHRMTMHPKTAANIAHGSAKYGAERIRQEAM